MIAGYKVIEPLQRNGGTDVLRCVEISSQRPVIIKQRPIGTLESAQLRHEYRLLMMLAQKNVPHVVRPKALLEDQGYVALLLEDEGATAVLNTQGALSRRDALFIARAMAEALVGVHEAGIIHKDIKPDNIVFNRDKRVVQLIDFGIATAVDREAQAVDSLHRLEGTVAYVSPEQTGRTNRMVDYRSDFYSLGVVLYEMMTGVLPFTGDNVVQLVHAILSRVPAKPRNVPEPVVDITFKLLEKDPEKRYQSAEGILHDLQQCLDNLQDDGSIASFAIAKHDVSRRFEIPQRLYGRALDVGALLSAYQRVSTGKTEALLLAGPSGIGKTSVVQELRGAMLHNNGLYAAGKYDQLRRHIPFSGFGQALDGVVRRILREPEDVLQAWRQRLQQAVGRLGRVLFDITPTLALLLGNQDELYNLPPQESENRLFMVLTRFLSALHSEQPLLLFLDDMQWADGGTLKLLRQISATKHSGSGFLLVGAYRDTEVQPDHPLMSALDDMQKAGMKMSTRVIAPMSLEDVLDLLVDTTHAPRSEASRLAALVFEKTGGNPFFVHELTRELFTKGLLKFRDDARSWGWDLNAVHGLQVSDSVAGLMSAKLGTLTQSAQRTLSKAACLGAEFSFHRLRCVVDGPALTDELTAAVKSGLLIPTDGAYRYVGDTGADAHYRFAHDRVQQAAYDMLDAAERERVHADIGRRLLDMAQRSDAKVQTWVFSVVNHLNLGRSCLRETTEREGLVRLNLLAGTESRRAAAYEVAHGYLTCALEILTDLDKDTFHSLARDVRLAIADCEAVLGRVPEALTRMDDVLRDSKTDVEAAQAQVRRVVLLMRMGQGAKAIEAGMAGLKRLGYNLRANARGARMEQLRTKLIMRGRPLERLATWPESNDARALTLCQLLGAMSPPMIFSGNGAGYGATSLGNVRLAAQYGLHNDVLVGFGGAVLDASCRRVDYASAREHSALARKLFDRFAGSAGRTQALMLSYMCYEYLTVSPTKLLAMCDEALQFALEAGDPIATVTFRMVQPSVAFQVSLGLAQERYNTHAAALAASKDKVRASFATSSYHATVGLLTSMDEGMAGIDGEIAKAKEAKFTPAVAMARKMMLAYYDRRIDMGVEVARAIYKTNWLRSYLDYDPMMASFYIAMLLIEDARAKKQSTPGAGADGELWRFVDHKIRAAGAASSNGYMGLVHLLDAELASLRGDEGQALPLYERAEATLAQGGLLSFRAIASETAARFFAARNRPSVALGFVMQAREAYMLWGAVAKVESLDREFAEHLLQVSASTANQTSPLASERGASSRRGPTSGHGRRTTSSSKTGRTTGSYDLDVPALMEAAQALASERDTATLLPKVLQSVTEVAGATKAVLLVLHGDKREAVAQPEGNTEVPESVIHYVQRSREALVLDVVEEGDYAADPYVHTHKPKSILCAPLVQGDQLKGIVYLENDVATAAFTEERMLSVKVLASQAAVAVENAYLYARLEETVAERTNELGRAHAALLQLERTNTEARMAGGFAHEMRNALSGPSYVLDAVLQSKADVGPLTPEMRDVLDTVHEGVVKGLSMVDRILWFAQMERLPGANENTVLAESLDKVLGDLKSRLQQEDIAFEVGVDPGTRVAVQAEHVEAILGALVTNAADALTSCEDKRGRRISLRTEVLPQDKVVALHVQDNGVGMAASTQARVFEPFFSTKGVGGTGLSLGVSKKLVGMYGGALTFTSEQSKGTEFVVRFPLRA